MCKIKLLLIIFITSFSVSALGVTVDFETETLGDKAEGYNGGILGIEIYTSADSGLRIVDNDELQTLVFSTTRCGEGNQCLYTREIASSTSFLYIKLPTLTNEVSLNFTSNVEGDLFLNGYNGSFGIDDKVASFRDPFQSHLGVETLTLSSSQSFDYISLGLIMRSSPYIDNIIFVVDNINVASPVPLPPSMALFLSGFILLFNSRRKHTKQ